MSRLLLHILFSTQQIGSGEEKRTRACKKDVLIGCFMKTVLFFVPKTRVLDLRDFGYMEKQCDAVVGCPCYDLPVAD